MIQNPAQQQLVLDTLRTNLQDPISAIRSELAAASNPIIPAILQLS